MPFDPSSFKKEKDWRTTPYAPADVTAKVCQTYRTPCQEDNMKKDVEEFDDERIDRDRKAESIDAKSGWNGLMLAASICVLAFLSIAGYGLSSRQLTYCWGIAPSIFLAIVILYAFSKSCYHGRIITAYYRRVKTDHSIL